MVFDCLSKRKYGVIKDHLPSSTIEKNYIKG